MTDPRRILFLMRHSGFVRNFECLLHELAQRGHLVHLGFEMSREDTTLAEALAEQHPTLTWGAAPVRSDSWTSLAHDLRGGSDGLRYLTHEYVAAPKLRERGLRSMPLAVRLAVSLPGGRSRWALRGLDASLRRLEGALPPDVGVERFLDDQRPHLVLVTPLVAGPTQDDIVVAARRRHIPTALAVTSWDNLTNKGVIRPTLDRLLVWNEGQRREAMQMHGVPGERIVVTGAHSYDHWFNWAPTRDRDAFAAQVGLPADRPIVLYLCSSKFIAPDEPAFVRRWLRALRAGPAPIRDAAVLVRPHPATGWWWADVDLGEHGPVSVWPRTGASPADVESKQDYFDSMYHCAAAVGINTSALIELAIIGRPVFTVLEPEFRDTQEGTLHFSHLTDAGGGLLTVARDLDEHLDHLAGTIAADSSFARREEFLRAFVRPHGLGRPAAPIMADAIEAMHVSAPVAIPGRLDALLRALLLPVRGSGLPTGRKRGLRFRAKRRLRRARMGKRARRARRQVARRWRRARRRVTRRLPFAR